MQNREQEFQQSQTTSYATGYQPSSFWNGEQAFERDGDHPPVPAEPFVSHDPYHTYTASPRQFPNPQNSVQSSLPAVLCYVGLWLTGLLFLLFEKKDRFVRFHAMQSLLFFGAVNVLYVVFISIMANQVPFLLGFAIFAFVLMNVIAVIAWFVGMTGALQGRYVKLPFVGDIAERYVNTSASPK
jgi:uncharacterized membrane protein